MTIEVKHATQATGTDAGNGEIRKTQWNESHAISMASGALLGRSTAGAGAAEEIAIGSGLSLADGMLSATGGGGTPGGATTQVQFNNAGAFAGAAGLTIDATTGAIKTATDTVYELVGTAVSATNGALQFKTLSGATTLTESLASGQAVTLEIYAGAFSITWPTVYWLNTTSSTTAPILNTTGPTIIELWKRGTTLYGSKVA